MQPDDDDWVGRASAPAAGIEDVHRMEDELTEIAERHGGEYDGFALEVG